MTMTFKELKFQVDGGCRKIRNYFQSFPINFPTLWLQKKEKKKFKMFWINLKEKSQGREHEKLFKLIPKVKFYYWLN